MQNSYAGGYGYDKRSHAVHVTAKKYAEYLDIIKGCIRKARYE